MDFGLGLSRRILGERDGAIGGNRELIGGVEHHLRFYRAIMIAGMRAHAADVSYFHSGDVNARAFLQLSGIGEAGADGETLGVMSPDQFGGEDCQHDAGDHEGDDLSRQLRRVRLRGIHQAVLASLSPLRGFAFFHSRSHGLRRGLYSCAASRLEN